MEQEFNGKELDELMQRLKTSELRKGLKAGYRKTARMARKVALEYLHRSDLQVKGNKADLDKGLRAYIYSKGGGFMLTVKARRANKSGKGEKGMHENRKGKKKPVLMWAEDGTQPRKAKGDFKYEWSGNWKLWSRHGGKYKPKKKRKYTSGQDRGKMPAYEFLAKATPEAFRVVEQELSNQIKEGVEKVARKSGLF